MKITVGERGEIKLVGVSGEVDLETSPRLRENLQQALAERPPGLVVDLHGCEYMDSSGVATLIEAFQRVGAYGGRLELARVNERVKDIFELAHLDGVFRMHENLDDAFASAEER